VVVHVGAHPGDVRQRLRVKHVFSLHANLKSKQEVTVQLEGSIDELVSEGVDLIYAYHLIVLVVIL
jgi:hypothetical protein